MERNRKKKTFFLPIVLTTNCTFLYSLFVEIAMANALLPNMVEVVQW